MQIFFCGMNFNSMGYICKIREKKLNYVKFNFLSDIQICSCFLPGKISGIIYFLNLHVKKFFF